METLEDCKNLDDLRYYLYNVVWPRDVDRYIEGLLLIQDSINNNKPITVHFNK